MNFNASLSLRSNFEINLTQKRFYLIIPQAFINMDTAIEQ